MQPAHGRQRLCLQRLLALVEPHAAGVVDEHDERVQVLPAARRGTQAEIVLLAVAGAEGLDIELADVVQAVAADLHAKADRGRDLDLLVVEPFAGCRKGLAKSLLRFARDYRYYRRTRYGGPGFEPCFRGGDYEMRREGAFIPYRSAAERGAPVPTVSVVVAAGRDPAHLEEWLNRLAGQTCPPAEVLIVGGIDATCAPASQRAPDPFEIRPLPRVTDSLDVVARVHARGDWWLTMQDDGLLPYADHIEVLLDAALSAGAGMATAWTWPVEADDEHSRDAHRHHWPRSIEVTPMPERPSCLTRRHARHDELSTLPAVEVGKLTTVRYRLEGHAQT